MVPTYCVCVPAILFSSLYPLVPTADLLAAAKASFCSLLNFLVVTGSFPTNVDIPFKAIISYPFWYLSAKKKAALRGFLLIFFIAYASTEVLTTLNVVNALTGVTNNLIDPEEISASNDANSEPVVIVAY